MLRTLLDYIAVIGQTFKREFQLIFSDSAVYSSYIGATLLVGFLYSYIYSHENIVNLSVVVVDQDQTQMSHKIIRMIDATQQVKVEYSAPNLEAAQHLFDYGKVKGIIVIPHDFSRKLQQGNVPSVSVYCDASYMLYYKQMLTSVTTSVGTFSAEVEVNKMMGGGLPQRQAIASRRPIETISKPLFNLNGGYGTFLMPIVFLVAVQTLQISAMGVMGGTQRERGIYNQLYPFVRRRLGTIPVLLGRSGVYLLISSFLMFIQIGIVMTVFDFPQRGNPWEVMIFLIPFILSVTFLGITLMNLFKHREDALMTVTISSIPSLFLCGVSWPAIAFPEWIKSISYLFPTTLGVKGFMEMTQFGASLSEIKKVWMELWGICLFYFILAAMTLKRLSIVNLGKEKTSK